MNIYSRTFGPVRAGQVKMRDISMAENQVGGPGRCEIPTQAQDLAPAPRQIGPLFDQKDSAEPPHLVNLADVYGYGPSAPGWPEPRRSAGGRP